MNKNKITDTQFYNYLQEGSMFYRFAKELADLGAIQVLRNAIFLEIGPPPTPS